MGVLLSVLWPAWALGEPDARFCATERYAAVSFAFPEPTLRVVTLDDPSSIRQLSVKRLPGDLACAGAAVYMRDGNVTVAIELGGTDLTTSSGRPWGRVVRSSRHSAGKLRYGHVYRLPKPAFALALLRATGGDVGERDDVRAAVGLCSARAR